VAKRRVFLHRGVFPLLLLLLSLPLPLPQRQRQRREDAPRSACFRDPSAKPSAILPRKINQSIVDSAVLSFWIMACRAYPCHGIVVARSG